MDIQRFRFPDSPALTVGSFGDAESLKQASQDSLAAECDISEIRLDLLHREIPSLGKDLWQHLGNFPLLFTARCMSEGSPIDLTSKQREGMLRDILPYAKLIDIEVASIPDMGELIDEMVDSGIPWIASYHDFEKLPPRNRLESQLEIARDAGAAAFKCAAYLETFADLATLAQFQESDQAIPVASMGMGRLAPVSRLLCAQAGSVLNYGFIGTTETAPGQWSAKRLREAIRSLPQQ